MNYQRLAATVIGFGLIAIACQLDGQVSTAPTPAQLSQPAATVVSETADESENGHVSELNHELDGQDIYATVGCAACHGADATGTDFAPALAGHSVAQVKRQARAPIGTMPVFPPDKISNEELQELAEFIASLEGGHAHVRAGTSGDDLLMHHWMALFALEAGEVDEASHHLDHILDGVQGQHQNLMEQSKALLSEGDVHQAAHIVEEMLAGLDEGELDQPAMHMQLAMSSLMVDDLGTAIHQVEHFAETSAEDKKEAAQHILDALDSGDLHMAKEGMAVLLGEDALAEDHEEADEHDTDAQHEEPDADAHEEADEHDADAHDEEPDADAHEEADEHDADAHHEEADAEEEAHPDDGHSN